MRQSCTKNDELRLQRCQYPPSFRKGFPASVYPSLHAFIIANNGERAVPYFRLQSPMLKLQGREREDNLWAITFIIKGVFVLHQYTARNVRNRFSDRPRILECCTHICRHVLVKQPITPHAQFLPPLRGFAPSVRSSHYGKSGNRLVARTATVWSLIQRRRTAPTR